MINAKQQQELEEKYGKLMHKVSNWISGDNAIASHDDNVQDLWVVALSTIETFTRLNKELYPHGYDDYKDTPHFDKYFKTALWNLKNSKGAKITKKWTITRGTVDVTGNEEVLNMEDASCLSAESDFYLGEIPHKLNEEQTQLVNLIVNDPKFIKPSGKANVSALAQTMNKSWTDVQKLITEVGVKIKNDL